MGGEEWGLRECNAYGWKVWGQIKRRMLSSYKINLAFTCPPPPTNPFPECSTLRRYMLLQTQRHASWTIIWSPSSPSCSRTSMQTLHLSLSIYLFPCLSTKIDLATVTSIQLACFCLIPISPFLWYLCPLSKHNLLCISMLKTQFERHIGLWTETPNFPPKFTPNFRLNYLRVLGLGFMI